MCLERIYGLLLFFILSSTGLAAQSDSVIFPYNSIQYSDENQGRFLLDASPYALIIDDQGVPVYQRSYLSGIRNFTPLNDTSFAVYSKQFKAFLILDEQMLVIDTVRMAGDYTLDFHHISLQDNGNLILLGQDHRAIDMSITIWDGKEHATIIGAVIQELDQDKNLLHEWKSLDYIGIGDTLSCSVNPLVQSIDYIHVNSVQADTDSTWIISCRNLDQVIKVHKESGEILWRLGGAGNQFHFTNDSIGFSGQHSVHLHANGDLSLFDNGNCKNEKNSRAVVYSLNQEEKTLRLTRSLKHTPPVFAMIMGNYKLFPGAYSLAGWGQNSNKVIFTRYLEEFALLEMVLKEAYSLFPYAVHSTEWSSPIEIINDGPLSPEITKKGDTLLLELEFHNTLDQEASPLALHFNGAQVKFQDSTALPLAAGETRLMKVYCIPEDAGNLENRLTAYFKYESDSFGPIAGSQIRLNLKVSDPSGTESARISSPSIKLFPNPVDEIIDIELMVPVDKLCIYSLGGIQVMELEQTGIGSQRVSVSKLSAGTYVVRGTSRSGKMLRSLFIKLD